MLIGLERLVRRRNAGLAVNTLVAVGACVYILVSEGVNYAAMQNGEAINNDNLRVLSQVVTGIGFLGAGVIMKDGLTIHGLNSAATIWCSAAVGCLCGFGMWQQAVMAVVAIVAVNWILRNVERHIDKKREKHDDGNATPSEE